MKRIMRGKKITNNEGYKYIKQEMNTNSDYQPIKSDNSKRY